jgi:hypothetical protein
MIEEYEQIIEELQQEIKELRQVNKDLSLALLKEMKRSVEKLIK